MTDHHRPSAFGPQDQAHFRYSDYFTRLEPDVGFAQIFDPGFWLHAKEKLKVDDIVRIQAHDREFDITVTVQAVVAGGIIMRFLTGDPGSNIDDPFRAIAEIRNRNIEPKVVPLNKDGEPIIRFEFIPTTKWRILGLNGAEVARDIQTKPEAELKYQAYLKEINMRLPTAEEVEAHKAKATKK